MGKQEQLIEYIIQDIVDMFSSDQDIEYDEAMNLSLIHISMDLDMIRFFIFLREE